MPKHAVYNPSLGNNLNTNSSELKRFSILFDKIYVPDSVESSDTIKDIDLVGIEYLEKNGIIQLYDKRTIMQDAVVSEKDQDFINVYNEYINDLERTDELTQMPLSSMTPLLVSTIIIDDIYSRIDAIELAKKYNTEFYPILKVQPSSYAEIGKKAEVVQFILSKIPEPDSNTPWEALIDFRLDQDLKNKRLALINWINEIALTPHSISDIVDKYEYLYSEYLKAFQLHKLKYTGSIIEVLVTAGAAMLTGQPIFGLKLASDIIKVKLNSIKLLEEEMKLPGKEIAYIIKANETF